MNPFASTANPEQKKRRMAALAGIGLLGLLFIMSRRGSAKNAATASSAAGGGYTAQDLADAQQSAASQQADADQIDSGAYGTPSTFADNGEQAGALGDDVTSSLGDLGNTLSGLQTADQNLASAIQAQQQSSGTSSSGSGSDGTDPGLGLIAGILAGVAAGGNGQKRTGGSKTAGGSKGAHNTRGGAAAHTGGGKGSTRRTTPGAGRTTVANHGHGQSVERQAAGAVRAGAHTPSRSTRRHR